MILTPEKFPNLFTQSPCAKEIFTPKELVYVSKPYPAKPCPSLRFFPLRAKLDIVIPAIGRVHPLSIKNFQNLPHTIPTNLVQRMSRAESAKTLALPGSCALKTIHRVLLCHSIKIEKQFPENLPISIRHIYPLPPPVAPRQEPADRFALRQCSPAM